MAEHNFSVENTLTLLLDDKKYHSLRDILSTMNPADIAAIFDDLDQACLPLLFRLLPKELAAETFVEMEPEAQELLKRYESFLEYALPLYVKEGKSQLTIAVGCTGGKHRSVCIAKELYEFVSKKGYAATLSHRDMGRR